MPGIPDGDISKELTIRPQNVVRSGTHLPSLPDHTSRPPVLAPRAPAREEVRRHVLKSLRRYSHRDILSPPFALWIQQVGIHRHQQSGAPGALFERGNENIYRHGVVTVEVTSYYVTPPLSHCQLEADNVG